METSEAKKCQEKSFWEQGEQIARIAAQFAAVLALIGGLLGAITITMMVAYTLGLRDAKGVSVTRFMDLPLPIFEHIGRIYSIFAGSNFVSILTVIALGTLAGVLIFWPLFWFLEKITRSCKAAFVLLNLVLIYILKITTSGEQFQSLVVTLWLTVVFYKVYKSAQNDSPPPISLKSQIPQFMGVVCRLLNSMVEKISLPFAILFGAIYLINLFISSVGATAFFSKSIGWIQGVQEICSSPQVIFASEKTMSISSDQKAFLLLRTDKEYYVFTTTVTATLPPPPANIKSLADPLIKKSLPFTTGCSPANIIIIPATGVGEVTLVYDEQVKPGPCCQPIPLSP